MERDDMSEEEAQELFDSVREEADIYIRGGDDIAVEDLLIDDLGLEIDYMPDFLEG
jgi:hypothetical protein